MAFPANPQNGRLHTEGKNTYIWTERETSWTLLPFTLEEMAAIRALLGKEAQEGLVVGSNRSNLETIAPAVSNSNKIAYARNDETVLGTTYREGFYLSDGVSWNYLDLRVNLTTHPTLDPTVNDDSTTGNFVGDIWRNDSTGQYFICAGNSAGAAVWTNLSQNGRLKRVINITQTIAAGVNFTLNAAGTGYTIAGDTVDFVDSVRFNDDTQVLVYLNGSRLIKGTDVTYVNNLQFTLSVAVDNGDIIRIITN